MKTLFVVMALGFSSHAFASPIPHCADGRYLVGVTKANVPSAMQSLGAAQAAGQVSVLSTRNSGNLVLVSILAKDPAPVQALADLPGSIVECDEVIDPGF